jgi:hypothetical protein
MPHKLSPWIKATLARFTQQNIEDVIALSGHTPKAQAEIADIGRDAWVALRLDVLGEVAEEKGVTIDQFLAEELALRGLRGYDGNGSLHRDDVD